MLGVRPHDLTASLDHTRQVAARRLQNAEERDYSRYHACSFRNWGAVSVGQTDFSRCESSCEGQMWPSRSPGLLPVIDGSQSVLQQPGGAASRSECDMMASWTCKL